MAKTTSVTRQQIENLIKRINETENARPAQTVEETIEQIDALMAPDVEGWANGQHQSNRSAEREFERALYGFLDDYHRDIERILIDPPFASFAWRAGSAKRNLQILGCTIMKASEEGLMQRYWIYFDPGPLKAIGM